MNKTLTNYYQGGGTPVAADVFSGANVSVGNLVTATATAGSLTVAGNATLSTMTAAYANLGSISVRGNTVFLGNVRFTANVALNAPPLYDSGYVGNMLIKTSANPALHAGVHVDVTNSLTAFSAAGAAVKLGFSGVTGAVSDAVVIRQNADLLTANMGINNTAPAHALAVTGPSMFVGNMTVFGDVSATGTVAATQFFTTSDARVKSNVRRIADPLAKLRGLTGYTFEMRGLDGRHAGVIAQDVEAVLPEAVRDDGTRKSVAYSGLYGVFVEAIKQLVERLERLEEAARTMPRTAAQTNI